MDELPRYWPDLDPRLFAEPVGKDEDARDPEPCECGDEDCAVVGKPYGYCINEC